LKNRDFTQNLRSQVKTCNGLVSSVIRATLAPQMRAILVVALILGLSPYLALAEPPRQSCTTLFVEFVGEMDRPVPSVVISTSSEEGEWYKQNLGPDFLRFITRVHVVPKSVFNQIAELPLLKRALGSAKPVDDEPKTPNNVRFTAGAGDHHVQRMLEAQTSTKILEEIAKLVVRHPALKSDLQEIEDHVKP
jgi:hypothetical protein